MNVLDSLFSILPFALALIWILSRVGRSRRKDQKPPKGASRPEKLPKAGPVGPAGAPRRPGKLPRSENLAEWLSQKAREVREEARTERAVPRGEEELYARMEVRKVERAEPPAAAPAPRMKKEETRRMVSDVESHDGRPADCPLKRIAALPPLAQGLLWSFILDEPPSLKEPEGP